MKKNLIKSKIIKITVISMMISSMMFGGCSSSSNNTEQSNTNTTSETTNTTNATSETTNTTIDEHTQNVDEIQLLGEIVGTIEEFYPFEANTFYDYEGDGVIATQEIFYTHISDDIAQRRIVAGNGDEITEVLEVSNGELRVLFGDTEGYHYESILEYSEDELKEMLNFDFPIMTVLKEPLALGNTWSFDGVAECEITAVDMEIDTPYGVFEAIEVTTTGISGPSQQYIQHDYYAKDIGLVKTVSTGVNDNYPMGFSLLDIEENSIINKEVTMFYNDIETNMLSHVEGLSINIETNDSIEEILTELFKKTPDDGFSPIFSEEMSINSIYVARPSLVDLENYVIVDLSTPFSSETMEGLDEDMEVRLLQSVALTCGFLFKSKRVDFRINGEFYSSENMSLTENDFFTLQ